MAVRYFNEEVEFRLRNKKVISKWIEHIINFYLFTCGDINFVFTSNPNILKINTQYLKHNYFTDIITFPNSEGKVLGGDIYISIDTVKENSSIFSVTFVNELHRVMIHGILHLAGLNDSTETEKAAMRNSEDKALSMLYSKFL